MLSRRSREPGFPAETGGAVSLPPKLPQDRWIFWEVQSPKRPLGSNRPDLRVIVSMQLVLEQVQRRCGLEGLFAGDVAAVAPPHRPTFHDDEKEGLGAHLPGEPPRVEAANFQGNPYCSPPPPRLYHSPNALVSSGVVVEAWVAWGAGSVSLNATESYVASLPMARLTFSVLPLSDKPMTRTSLATFSWGECDRLARQQAPRKMFVQGLRF